MEVKKFKNSRMDWAIAAVVLVVAAYFFLRPSTPELFTSAQMQSCRDALRSQASIPATVNFHATGFAAERSKDDGILRMRSDFSAKNAYGLELNFDGICIFEGDSPRAVIRPQAT